MVDTVVGETVVGDTVVGLGGGGGGGGGLGQAVPSAVPPPAYDVPRVPTLTRSPHSPALVCASL